MMKRVRHGMRVVVGGVLLSLSGAVFAQAQEETTAPSAHEHLGEARSIPYTAGTLRDPMTSLLPAEIPADGALLSQGTKAPPLAIQSAPPAPKPPQVVVQGVIWGGKKPQAIINGEVYGVNDLVDGTRIVAIGPDGVTVEVQGKAFVVRPTRDVKAVANQSSYIAGYPYQEHRR